MRSFSYFRLGVYCLFAVIDADCGGNTGGGADGDIQLCGNGVLDDGEACEGESFAAGARKCPTGYEIDDIGKIVC